MSEIKAKVIKKGGGYYFPDFDIHAVAKNPNEAKKIIKIGHGVDVDKATVDLADRKKSKSTNS